MFDATQLYALDISRRGLEGVSREDGDDDRGDGLWRVCRMACEPRLRLELEYEPTLDTVIEPLCNLCKLENSLTCPEDTIYQVCACCNGSARVICLISKWHEGNEHGFSSRGSIQYMVHFMV